MGYDANTVRTFVDDFLRSPKKALVNAGNCLICRIKAPVQIKRLRELTRQSPLILQIETINVCNAACIFCAYKGMSREKGVMSPGLFEKIVTDYAAMGGGAVSLTPVVGDVLLDPHFMERLRILSNHTTIDQISFTTNGIALNRLSDDDVRHILRACYCLQISIGGLDAATYELLYGVDRFKEVSLSMERLLKLRQEVTNPAEINFAFRTNDTKFQKRFRRLLENYRRRGVFVSHISAYANYSGMVSADKERNLVVLEGVSKNRNACIYPSVAMSVCRDGTVTACGCADFDGNKLVIGDATKESLAEIWLGKKRKMILDSFANGKLAPICLECSAYQPDKIFASSTFSGVEPQKPLPIEFYQQFWGG